MSVNLAIDRSTFFRKVDVRLQSALVRLGEQIRINAMRSMTPQTKIVKRSRGKTRTVFGSTPKGAPPKTRTGLIRDNIQIAVDGESVIVGPTYQPGHDRDCLPRLEYGNHPFMLPALVAALPSVPQAFSGNS